MTVLTVIVTIIIREWLASFYEEFSWRAVALLRLNCKFKTSIQNVAHSYSCSAAFAYNLVYPAQSCSYAPVPSDPKVMRYVIKYIETRNMIKISANTPDPQRHRQQ